MLSENRRMPAGGSAEMASCPTNRQVIDSGYLRNMEEE
jgi:hypothetical protein